MKTVLYTISFILCSLISLSAQAQLDPSFGDGGKVIAIIDSTYNSSAAFGDLAVLSNGKILAAGGGYGGRLMTRYFNNGIIDNSFGNQGKRIDSFAGNGTSSIAMQPDGKILTVGNSGSLERSLLNGGSDSSFGVNGKAVPGAGIRVSSLALQSDEKIVIAGTDYQNQIGIARYDTNGFIDSSFGLNGVVITNFNGPNTGNYNDVAISSILIQPDGKLVVSGDSKVTAIQAYAFIVMRYNTDGSLDTSFNHTGKVYTYVGGLPYGRDLKLQPDGKLLQCGMGGLGIALVRYNSDGSLDTSFDHTGIYSINGDWHECHRMALMLNGRIITAGVTDTNQCSLYCIFPNGGIDSSFGVNGRILTSLQNLFDCRIFTLHLYADGRILVGGNISAAAFLMRFLPDGHPTAIITPSKTAGEIKVYPNPANESVTILTPDVNGTLSVADIDGRIHIEKTVNGKPLHLNISGFIPGLYFIAIKTSTGQILHARFLKK